MEPGVLTRIAIVGTHDLARVKVMAKARGSARVGQKGKPYGSNPSPHKLLLKGGQTAMSKGVEPKVEGVQASRWKGGATWAKIHPPLLSGWNFLKRGSRIGTKFLQGK